MAKKGKHFRALDEARAAGYEVFIDHMPCPGGIHLGVYNDLPIQARTHVGLYRTVGDWENREHQFVAEGSAWCSTKDNFNRRLGVQIACGRALKQAQGR